MATRGVYGFRKNGIEKLSYNQYSSDFPYLGKWMADFLFSIYQEKGKEMKKELYSFFDSIQLKDENAIPTEEDREIIESRPVLYHVDDAPICSWYETLHGLQGDLQALYRLYTEHLPVYMADAGNVIKNSRICEYGYVVNLDSGKLEVFLGDQHKPQPGNRYGEECCDGHYPCRLQKQFPLTKSGIKQIFEYIKKEENL